MVRFSSLALFSSLTVPAVAAAASNDRFVEAAEGDSTVKQQLPNPHLDAAAASVGVPSSVEDPFVPRKIQQAREVYFQRHQHHDNRLKNKNDEDDNIDSSLDSSQDFSDEFGILGDHGRYGVDESLAVESSRDVLLEPERHLQDVPSRGSWRPGDSCEDYCKQFGDRPVIGPEKSFTNQVREYFQYNFVYPDFYKEEQFRVPLNCWNTSLVTDMGCFGSCDYYYDRGCFSSSCPFTSKTYRFPGKPYSKAFNKPLGCWDTSAVTDMSFMFFYAKSFNQPLDSWNTSAVQDMDNMFYSAQKFARALESWDTSAVKNMRSMFKGTRKFNRPVDSWDTSAVINMRSMFGRAKAFNQPVDSWDTSAVEDMTSMFFRAEAFDQPVDTWNTSAVTGMDFMFNSATSFNKPVNSWDTSAVNGMRGMFANTRKFNQPVDSWDTSGVTSMSSMFADTYAFNQSLDLWNTSAVRDMRSMFHDASAFNQAVNSWDISSVTKMYFMFRDTRKFNQPVDSWDISGVNSLWGIFYRADAFNQPVNSWNTSAVRDMDDMFANARAFNQPVDSWDTSAVTHMGAMFDSANAFNQPVNSWDTSSVNYMISMFAKTKKFNQPVDLLDTSAVTHMGYIYGSTRMKGMFYRAEAFNHPVNSWDTSAVRDMSGMFEEAKAFNQPVDAWNTSSVDNMGRMFSNARAFNQAVDAWDASAVTNMYEMFNGANAFNQCISTWAATTPSTVLTNKMLEQSGCPDKSSPDPNQGPWCQGPDVCPVLPPLPPPIVCKDEPKTFKFNYDNKKRRTCDYINEFLNRGRFTNSQKKRQKRRICGLDATTAGRVTLTLGPVSALCPRTCEICPDQCKNSRRVFLVDGKKRKCTYLKKTVLAKKKKLCDSTVKLENGKERPFKNLCQLGCGMVGIGRCAPFFQSTDEPTDELPEDIGFGYGCYTAPRCSCEPDECNKDLCELKGKRWIEPSVAEAIGYPNGCSLGTRCKDVCSVAPTPQP